MVVEVSSQEVSAFRLRAHHLTRPLGESGLPEAAGACGIQDSPPGSALLSLHARVNGVTQDCLDAAVSADKALIHTWCMRGAPYYVPTADAAVFTTGVCPPTDESMRQFVRGACPSVDQVGLSLTELVERTSAEVRGVLHGRRLAIEPLGKELAERIADTLSLQQRQVWESEGLHAPGQPVGEALVHFCVRILTLRQLVCFAPREGNTAPFVLVEEWLGAPLPVIDASRARAELVRRYLHCYGPSRRADFAAWLGVRASDVDPWWSLVEGEMTPVKYGRAAWILSEDLDALRSSPPPRGVRLLPPHDPYLQSRDRDTIVPRQFHKDVWKTVGAPGAIMVDGNLIGTWRPRKKGTALTLAMRTFDAPSTRIARLLHGEGERVAQVRGTTLLDVEFTTY